jgi:dipeptidyl aminopeptidase/acylaminoacyl peptidase
MDRHFSRRMAVVGASVAALLVVLCVGRLGAQVPTKRPLTYDVVDYWRSIQGTRLSADGQWLAYALTAPGDDGELVVRNLKTNQELKSPRGTNPTFTPDGKFVIFTVVPTKADDERANRAQGAGAPAPAAGAGGRAGGAGGDNSRNGLGIMALPGGQVTTVDQVATFRLPEDSSTWLAYHKGRAGGRGGRGGAGRAGGGGGRTGAPAAAPAPAAEGENAAAATTEKRKDPGTDLIVRNLATGQETTIAEVVDFAWDKTGAQIAYTVSSTDAAKDGAFLRRTADASVVTLHTGHGNYKALAFDDAGHQLAFLSDAAEYDKKVSPYRLYYWKTGDAAAAELVSAATRGMPAGFVVSDNFTPRFSDDNARLFLGTAPAPKPPRDENAPAPTRVDLWSYKDAEIQPMQQIRANQERARNYRAVVQLADKRFVQLATADLPTVNPGEDPIRALGTSDLPYQQEMSWDQTYNDVYLVDLKTGFRKKVLEHWGATATLSPGGNYVLYYDETKGNWFSYKVADGTRVNLTGMLPVKFFDESHDTPDAPPSLGVAGWTDGDKSVLLNDQFDIWEIHPDGTGARMITNGEGRKQHLVFRYRALDTETVGGRGGGGGGVAAPKPIPTTKPILLSTTNEDTRSSGFYRTSLSGTAAPEKLMIIDKGVGAPIKAKNADVVVFTEARFDEFPNLWVSDTNFASAKKVTDANPQQAEFVWGKAENIKFINGDGKVLTARLIKPENFDPSKKYPLMVYIYEELSNGLYSYQAPNVGTSINLTRYVSNGYVVLEPDIVYETGYPGPSAMKCVIPAINTVVAQGYIDPARIGIQGHSWGGYQITYMITQTNIFKAVEAGASVSNMISAYGGIRWGTGMVREFQYEKTQSRIGAPPWDDPLQFIENSPIFWIERIHTPYLTIHNDADTAVPWTQGIEFNTAMRRLGKEAYMFTFNGEQHGLTNRDNMKYWTVHMDEFFDYYLLGKPRPSWMDTGVPFLEKGLRDVAPLFKRAVNPPAAAVKGGGR